MDENITQMSERHIREVTQLRALCKHQKTTRLPFVWGTGHWDSDVELCLRCGKVTKHYDNRQFHYSFNKSDDGEVKHD